MLDKHEKARGKVFFLLSSPQSCSGKREGKRKGASLARLRGHRNPAVMGVKDFFYNNKAKASASVFSGER